MTKTARSVGTHDGTFHADEVTACALLLLVELIDSDKIYRTRDRQLLEKCQFVCDVGGIYDAQSLLFDHHQADYRGSFSSAGMVLLYLKNSGKISEEIYRLFNSSLVASVDAHDNGRAPQLAGFCSFSNIVSNFNPIEYSATPQEQDNAFKNALYFVLHHLQRLLARHHYMRSCRKLVKEAMLQEKEYLLFKQGMPWLESFFELDGKNHRALFVVMPSGKYWKLRGIPPSFEERMKVRLPLPLEWAGLLEEDLRHISKISGAVFCHKERFISVWESCEDALKALDYVLKKRSL